MPTLLTDTCIAESANFVFVIPGNSSDIISTHDRMGLHRGEITELLERLGEGDRSAENDLLPQVYLELHRLAMARMRTERIGHTLQATALVHEAYLRLCRSNHI